MNVPKEALAIPFQPVADSPTEKYYTDWRRFEKKLDLPPAQTLDNLKVTRPGEYCVLDPASTGDVDCGAVSVRVFEQPNPSLHERLALYHYFRSKQGLETILPDKSKILVLLRGGDGYTGYTLRLKTEPASRTEVILLDTALQPGLKTYRIIVEPGEGSIIQVTHAVLHSEQAPVYGIIEVKTSRGSRIVYKAGGKPGEMTRIRVETVLAEEDSRIDAILGYAARGSSQGDIILNTTHKARRTVSFVEGRGIARDRARLTLRGFARVLREAPGSATKVEMHVLVAGDLARGRSVPMLEIYTGDVAEASHSASATMLPEEVLFYAATRGLSPEETLSLIEAGILEKPGIMEVFELAGLRL